MPQISRFLEKIVQETQQSEPEIIAQAFQVGLKRLWREPVLGSYLKGEVTREAAIEAPTSEKIRILRTPQVERKGCLEWLRDPRNRLIYHLRGLLARPSGIDWVELAEHQCQAVLEDIQWGMNPLKKIS